MNQFDPQAYGAAFAPLLAIDRRRPLGTGTPDIAARATLEALSAESAFASVKIVDRDMAACCISGVWLLHDFLDESHTISQAVETPEGSFWHAVMHRREGDFSNSMYWLRRVGRHPVFETLGMRSVELAAERGNQRAATQLVSNGEWDPYAFVDLCQAAGRGQREVADLCLDIQQVEWELLFDYCYHAATT